MAKKATNAKETWQWNNDVTNGKPIVSEDGGKTWRFATPEEAAARADTEANAPPVPAGLASLASLAPVTPVVAPDGKTAKIGGETLDITNQTVNMDGHSKEAQISLHSPTDAKGNAVVGEGDYERMYKETVVRRDELELENGRLRLVNSQLMEANATAAKHLQDLQGRTLDSMGIPKAAGL